MERALLWIEEILTDLKKSEVYETKAVHGFGPAYFNAVVFGNTELDYNRFNSIIKRYERDCGRTPDAKIRNEVIIDIDIVIWDGEIIRPTDFSREFFQIGYKEIKE